MESCAASAGGARLAPRKCQAPAAIAISAATPDHEQRGDRAPGWSDRLGRLRQRWVADFERISADRLFDILELGRAEISHLHVEPAAHLTVGVLGKTDRAGLGNSLQSRGDVDAVAHQVAVALLDDVAEMDADAELDAALGRQARVAFDQAALDFDRAADGVDDAAELDDRAVASALDDRPWCTEMVGSIRSLRSARSRASVRSSSAPASRL